MPHDYNCCGQQERPHWRPYYNRECNCGCGSSNFDFNSSRLVSCFETQMNRAYNLSIGMLHWNIGASLGSLLGGLFFNRNTSYTNFNGGFFGGNTGFFGGNTGYTGFTGYLGGNNGGYTGFTGYTGNNGFNMSGLNINNLLGYTGYLGNGNFSIPTSSTPTSSTPTSSTPTSSTPTSSTPTTPAPVQPEKPEIKPEDLLNALKKEGAKAVASNPVAGTQDIQGTVKLGNTKEANADSRKDGYPTCFTITDAHGEYVFEYVGTSGGKPVYKIKDNEVSSDDKTSGQSRSDLHFNSENEYTIDSIENGQIKMSTKNPKKAYSWNA